MIFFTEIEKAITKVLLKHKRPGIGTAILCYMNIGKDITIPDFKTDHKATGTKIPSYRHINRPIGQWNRIENPEKVYIFIAD
jgi:hypothetical protein